MRKHFLFALLAVLFTVLPARIGHYLGVSGSVRYFEEGATANVHA